MPPAKRSAATQSKRNVRGCVVRLEQVKQSPTSDTSPPNTGRSTRATQQHEEEEPSRGGRVVKKRLLSETTTTPTTETKAKPKAQPKSTTKKQTSVEKEVVLPSETIASGRSRRSIKPNPKYANEDIVTPKLIKHVGQQPTPTASTSRKQLSASDIDDFFNKDSTSDSEMSFENLATSRKPTRPTKEIKSTAKPRPNQDASNRDNKPITLRSTPVPIRRSLAASISANRSTSLAGGQKRRLEISREDDEEQASITRKRLMLGETGSGVKEQQTAVGRKTLSGQTFNGSKVLSSTQNAPTAPSILRSTPLQRKEHATKQQHQTGTISNQKSTSNSAGKSDATKTFAQKRQQPFERQLLEEEEDIEESELMPTFTIVNINDIINKKGDVLISKTDLPTKLPSKPEPLTRRPQPVSKPQPPKPQPSNASAIITISDDPEPRRTVPNAVRAEKLSQTQSKPQAVRTPPTAAAAAAAKKQAPTILNHMLHNRTTTTAQHQQQQRHVEKPAPRILNSMVAKKTQPIKPKIANFEDSADESTIFDEDDELMLDLIDPQVNPTKPKSPIRQQQSKRTPLNTSTAKTPVPGAVKENLQGATNRLETKSIQRKHSPEKVVISRQGDKIIKKITCYENWHVITPREFPPEVPLRNLLDIPLIKLANLAKNIQLPSEHWNSHINLFEVTSATLAKSKLTIFTGDLDEHGFSEENRHKYQPSCITFRRLARQSNPRLPYDRVIIFKNKTFFTNIEGRNVRLVGGAPNKVSLISDVETLIDLLDYLDLESEFVESASPLVTNK